MSSKTGKTALVTGASAGIGKAFAEQLAARGYDLVVTARRRERLDALARELAAGHGVRVEVVPEDLADPAAPLRLFDEVQRRGIAVDMLVNNAGYGISRPYARTQWREQAEFLQVLVTSVAHLAHLFLPEMIARGEGYILNVASLAGLIPGAPGNTLYAAAKAFVIKFSESLALEVRERGVRVTALCPGFTFSEFHDVNHTRERMQKLPSAMWMDAETVARQGIEAVLAGEVVYVNGGLNKLIAQAMRYMPVQLARGLMSRNARMLRDVD